MVETASTLDLVYDSDTELWLVKGDGFCLPVYATPCHDERSPKLYTLVEMMDQYDAQQREVVTKHFGSLNISKSSTLLVERDKFASLCEKAPGITPMYYFQWKEQKPDELGVAPDEQLEESKEVEKFLKFVQRQSQVASLPLLRTIWVALNRCLLKWLIEQRQPVRFWFFKLLPVPYRPDWKARLHDWHGLHDGAFLPNVSDARRDAILMECQFEQSLRGAKLMALEVKGHHFHWTLEAVPNQIWNKAERDLEQSRQQLKGGADYADYYLNMVNRHRDDIVRAYAEYVRLATLPHGELRESRAPGRPMVVPSQRQRLSQRAPKRVAPPLAPLPGPLQIQGGPEAVEGAVGLVQPVRDPEPQVGDVRPALDI